MTRVVGVRTGDGSVHVASQSDDETELVVIAGLDEFWADPAGYLAGAPSGPRLAAGGVEVVPRDLYRAELLEAHC
jgi:hypothetical protein